MLFHNLVEIYWNIKNNREKILKFIFNICVNASAASAHIGELYSAMYLIAEKQHLLPLQ